MCVCNRKLKIGWSCWGVLGDGIKDTPDGGRSHRKILIEKLINLEFNIVMLQKNRDLIEANEIVSLFGLSFDERFPDIDILFLEYRWAISGRNTLEDKESVSFTPDLLRQIELIDYYKNKIPILIWDKDQKIDENFRLDCKKYKILEAKLFVQENREQLLFPMDKEKTKFAFNKIIDYKKNTRKIQLVYIGNQYERDESFEKYINCSGRELERVYVYGNWIKYKDKAIENKLKFKNVNFKGRLHFKYVEKVYEKSLVTVLIAPQKYYNSGQFTQRIFESLWGGCIPLCPKEYKGINDIIISEWQVEDAKDVIKKIKEIEMMSNEDIIKLFYKQFILLKKFEDILQAENLKKIILKELNDEK